MPARAHGGVEKVLIAVLILGIPAFGAMFTPSMSLLSKGAKLRGLDQGLAFGLATWPGPAARPLRRRAAASWPR